MRQTEMRTNGLYSIQAAAAYAGLADARRAKRWLFGGGQYDPVLRRYYDDGMVSFVDMVQMMAIRSIRARRAVSLQKIHQAIERAMAYGIEYPFARRHETYVFDGDVVLKLPNNMVIGLTGDIRDQHLMDKVVEPYLNDLGFDTNTGLANYYSPLAEKDRRIVLSPHMRLGAPVVLPCGYQVSTLVDAVESEGGTEAAARAYGVDGQDIMLALRYEASLSKVAA